MANSNRMIARHTHGDDDFPTPPWATRSLLEYVLPVRGGKVWEPACGRGYMSRTIAEYGPSVYSSDAVDYGFGKVQDFLTPSNRLVNWVITNPPYKSAEAFFHRASQCTADGGVALLVRLGWLQNPGRYLRIFNVRPPSTVALFANRMPAAHGKVIRGPSGYFQHCWVVWRHGGRETETIWIPPDAQKRLERDSDYK